MLNFKKGLAIVLAAATAFTFAPLTSFGLTGTVEAQAAGSFEYTTGGVLAGFPAYDGATVDLIENAVVSYTNGSTKINYDKKELIWHLTTTNATVGEENPRLTDVTINSTNGSVSAGKGVLTVNIKNTDGFIANLGTAYAVAVYPINGKYTVVSKTAVSPVKVISDFASDSATKVVAASSDVNVSIVAKKNVTANSDDKYEKVLDDVMITDPDLNNNYVDLSDAKYVSGFDIASSAATLQTSNKFELNVVKGEKKAVFKGSYIIQKPQTEDLANGNYHETAYIPYLLKNGSTVVVLKVNITASVSTGPKFRVKDKGNILVSTFSDDTAKIAVDPTVYLDLKENKTFDISKHIESDISGTTYTYESETSNVTVDSNGLITAKTVGYADIKITPKAGSVAGDSAYLHVVINQNPRAKFTITGKDADTADVLDVNTYNNNAGRLKTEKQLAAAQLKYIQIEDKTDETSDIKEAIKTTTTATGASISYRFVVNNTEVNAYKGLTINEQTGEITVPYGKTEFAAVNGEAIAVKVVSSGASGYEPTTGYFYFVVDYPDAKYSGLQDAYTVGTDKGDVQEKAIKFGSPEDVKLGDAADAYYEAMNNGDDALKGDTDLYSDESSASYNTNIKYNTGFGLAPGVATSVDNAAAYVDDATAAGKTMYILVDFVMDKTHGWGHTYKVVKLTSAEGKVNTIDKIVNTDTNEVLFDKSKDTTTAPQLTINGVTHLTVTLAYPVDKNQTKFLLKTQYITDTATDIINQPRYVTAVKDDKVSVTLYPNEKGTMVIGFVPEGRISDTDRTITRDDTVKVAVTYSGEFVKPAKVTGLKVSNKKGAKVTVKFNKVDTNPTMRYYVQKKIGKKVSGKSIGSTKTTLSVKKGATVKVRVKAYFYDESGKKHVGKYSAWKTLKTDKK